MNITLISACIKFATKKKTKKRACTTSYWVNIDSFGELFFQSPHLLHAAVAHTHTKKKKKKADNNNNNNKKTEINQRTDKFTSE